MNTIQTLIDRFWVVKEQDRDLYHRLRIDISAAEHFARDYPGWRLMMNERLLKLEKLPSHAQPWMGIADFTETTDYILFCALLIFLEDLEDQEAFLLSELIDRMEIQLKPVMELDWTRFTLRKSLIRVMQFAQKRYLLVIHEGNIDAVSGDIHQEVLYENTGLSRYFAVSYGTDTSSCRSAADFEKAAFEDADMDRGHFRINRVYRTLLTGPAMYWDSVEDADSLYLKNQRQWVTKYLEENTGGRLDIHRNAAFYLQERDGFGQLFPTDSTLCDIVLLMCSLLRERQEGSMSPDEFAAIAEECAARFAPAWSKEYREMAPAKRVEILMKTMDEWNMIGIRGEEIVLRPAVFKFSGMYPPGVDIDKLGEDNGQVQQKKTRHIKEKGAKDQPDGQMSLFDL